MCTTLPASVFALSKGSEWNFGSLESLEPSVLDTLTLLIMQKPALMVTAKVAEIDALWDQRKRNENGVFSPECHDLSVKPRLNTEPWRGENAALWAQDNAWPLQAGGWELEPGFTEV